MNIPICFATNDNYAPHAAALIVSVMDNKLPDDEMTFYCFGDKLTGETKKTFQTMSSQLGFTLYLIEVNDELLKDAPDFHGGKTAYFKLLIPRLLPKALTKVLYLDCDMIVMDSLAELFATDVSEKYAAVVGEALKMPHFPAHPPHPILPNLRILTLECCCLIQKNTGKTISRKKRLNLSKSIPNGFSSATRTFSMLFLAVM